MKCETVKGVRTTALNTNPGLFSSTHFHIVFSVSVFNAAYTYKLFKSSDSSFGWFHPFLIASSLNWFTSIVNSFSGTGNSAAMEDEVYTTRLTLGSLKEAFKALRPPLMAVGIAILGSLPPRGDATWMKPLVPVRGRLRQ